MSNSPVNDRVPYEALGLPRQIVVWLTIFVTLWYMWWRLSTINPEYPIFSRVLYGAEWFGFVTLMLHYFMVGKLTIREAPLPEPGLHVDVFVPTYNEPEEIVRRTLVNAIAMEYPHKTYLLDDGNRNSMRELALELGCEYIAREDNEHAKAGNLNNALEHSNGEFIAIFDADHAPKSTFLLRTLGYFHDPKVAFVQTPQDFYNLDSYQHRVSKKGRVWSEQSLFFRVIQRGKDYWNAAFFCGSCAIIRRSALEAIGGVATGTITEDLHTSIKLHKYGFKSVYHSESLALGIAPSQVEPFLKQRIRWGQGAMQVWRKEGIFFNRHLTLAQKLNYFASMSIYFDGWQKAIFYVTPIVVLLTGMVPLVTDTREFLIHFIPFFVVSIVCFEELGRGYGEMLYVEQYNLARCAAYCWSTLGLFMGNLKFRVTSKRMRGGFEQFIYMVPQYALLLGNMVALPIGYWLYRTTGHLNYFSLLANMVWASLNLALTMMVVTFSIGRSLYKRNNYRFAIPLVARLNTQAGREYFASIDDLSSAGMYLHAPRELQLAAGSHFTGVIFLPDGPLSFDATVRALHDREDSSTTDGLGCEFEWKDKVSQQRLERFLYGSDLEWHLHNLSEINFTLLPGTSDREHKVVPLPTWEKKRKFGLASAVVNANSPANDAVTAGIISMDPKTRLGTMLAFKPLPESAQDAYFDTLLLTGNGWKTMRTRVANQNKADRSYPNMYLYQLESLPV
ncbi:MAG: glycosyltransferase [Proteobacteria bacterium]|nr:glycosyltransferase [Pseudomonadota bacterium]